MNIRTPGGHALVAFTTAAHLLCSSLASAAKPDFESSLRAAQESFRHDSLKLEISLPKTSYFLGELIPVTFRFEDTQNTGKYEAWTGSYDRSGRIASLKFFIDGPAGSFCDPLLSYFGSGLFSGGGLGYYAKLGHYEQVFHLNEWIRFDQPGKYRFYATASRVSTSKDNQRHDVELVSPVIALQIRAATAEELDAALREAMAKVSEGNPRSGHTPAVSEALSRIRYLDTRESRSVLRQWLGGAEGAEHIAKFGLIGTRAPDDAIALLEDGIGDPDVAVTTSYLDALAKLRRDRAARQKDATPPSASPTLTLPLSGNWSGLDFLGDRADWQKLADAFDRKKGRARAVCAATLFALIQNERHQDQYEADAKAKGSVYLRPAKASIDHIAVMEKIRIPLAESLLQLTEPEQERILRDFWPLVHCTEFLPALQTIVKRPMQKPDVSFRSGLASLAMLRLAELDPAAGQALILEDVRRPEPKYSLEVLCSLPMDDLKKELPLFVSRFETRERVDLDKITGVIAHAGDDSIYDAVLRSYRGHEGRWACIVQKQCLAYFIRVRRGEGLDLAFRALDFRGPQQTRCYTSLASEVLAPAFGPDIESRMLRVLRSEMSPIVISDLSRVLLKHGSKAAIDPLLEVVGRLSPKAIQENYSYDTEAGARRVIVEGLIRAAAESDPQARWKLSASQKQRLRASLSSDQETKEFQSRFKAR